MAITSTYGAVNPGLDAIFDLFNAGVLEIRTGSPPGASAAPTGTLLASITLPNPAFGAASSKSKAKSGTWADSSADATGTAAHFRIKTSGDGGGSSNTDPRVEGTVTATGGGGDMELDDITIDAAQSITITSCTVTGATS